MLRTWFPKLHWAEWLIFALIAAGLSVTNIYTTLLTGWGDGGSIIAVIVSVLLLRVVLRNKQLTVHTLNIGQTLASAGGSVGFAVCAYAGVKMIDPKLQVSPAMMVLLFVAMGILGTVVGTSVRNIMVGYFFPSGTACAVIQKTVTGEGEDAKRPISLLARFGGLAALLTIPTKIAAKKGGHAIISNIKFGKGLGLSLDPLLFGIGIVVGPRIGLGMMIGALASPLFLIPMLKSNGVNPKQFGDWVKWMAIAVLTVPTFATIGFAYLFRSKPSQPAGFTPGATQYEKPAAYKAMLAVLFVIGTVLTAITIQSLFYVPWYLTLLTVGLSWPLCIMNGRVTGDTDINPVRLVAIVLLTAFAFFVVGKANSAMILMGMAIIGGTLAGMGVDMMQDLRTGYLVDANPYHQTTAQIFGSVVGALVAVPFILYLEKSVGFGPKTPLVAPGAQIWSAMAKAFAGEFTFSSSLITAIIVVSIVCSALAFLTVWPKTARFMPSLFGIGLGLLLPFSMCFAIFLGGLIKWVVTLVYTKGKQGEEKTEQLQAAGNDTMLVGSSVFAASAIVSVLVVVANALLPAIVHLPKH